MLLAEEVYYRAMRLVQDIAASNKYHWIATVDAKAIKAEAKAIVQEGKEALIP